LLSLDNVLADTASNSELREAFWTNGAAAGESWFRAIEVDVEMIMPAISPSYLGGNWPLLGMVQN
jgi:hypothetical protein